MGVVGGGLVERVASRLGVALDGGLLEDVLFGPHGVGHQDCSLGAWVVHNDAAVDVGAADDVGALARRLQLLHRVVGRRQRATRLRRLVGALGTVRMARLVGVQVRVVVEGPHRLVGLRGLVVRLLQQLVVFVNFELVVLGRLVLQLGAGYL